MNTLRTLSAALVLAASAAVATAQTVAFASVPPVADTYAVTPAAPAAPAPVAATHLMPTYPGGAEALAAAVAEGLEYPAIAQANGVEGTVVLSVRVDERGRATVAHVIESLSPACDAAAVAAVESLEGLVPARLEGRAFARKVRLAVNFSL